MLRGVSQTIAQGGNLSLSDSPDPAPGTGNWPLVIFVVVALAGAYLLHFTVFGRYVYAIGGNRDAARYSGINVKRVETLTYVISAVSAGIAGLCYAAYIKEMSQAVGISYELYAIAAAVLGGCSLRGGEGTVLGVVIGTFVMRVIQNGINMFQVAYHERTGASGSGPPGHEQGEHHHRRRDPAGGDPRPGDAPDAGRPADPQGGRAARRRPDRRHAGGDGLIAAGHASRSPKSSAALRLRVPGRVPRRRATPPFAPEKRPYPPARVRRRGRAAAGVPPVSQPTLPAPTSCLAPAGRRAGRSRAEHVRQLVGGQRLPPAGVGGLGGS